ncbi:hypothetical protein ACFXGA_27095 [Actinosynnema sp. NPDC059335]|uniref:hypothetical protein n=1 Tax=Actinosynnema sp. NPDC059335 TaxID=3346804 RepID=UPI0036703E7D
MWIWFAGGYAIFITALIDYAAHVALSGADTRRRADAYRVVLKLVLTSGAGAAGLAAVALRAYQLDLLA